MEIVQTVEEAVALLQNDHTNGARVLATNALKGMHAIVGRKTKDEAGLTLYELWQDIRIIGYRLAKARPSMSAAITSAVCSALRAIQAEWNDPELGNQYKWRNEDLRRCALDTLQEQIQQRDQTSKQLVDAFVEYLSKHAATNHGRIRILTLSSSSSLNACLYRATTTLTNVEIDLYVLESRPAMEGATFAINFMKGLETNGQANHVNITIGPDSHACTFAKDVDILLLGADRVSGAGDVSNKMGSLSAVLAVKTLSKAEIVVVAETDKIARPGGGIEAHEEEDNNPDEVINAWGQETLKDFENSRGSNVQVRNVYFEWVPKHYINVYITEQGLLDASKIRVISEAKGAFEDRIFDSKMLETIALNTV